MGKAKHHMEAETPQDIYNGKIVLTSVIDMDIGITKMSSKGQVVIPVEMRKKIKEGEKLVIIADEEWFILKKAGDLSKKVLEDIEFANKTEAASRQIEAGKGINMEFDDFIQEMKKW